MTVTIDTGSLDALASRLEANLEPMVLQAADAAVRAKLDEHWRIRQREPRRDGFPSVGFWDDVRSRVMPTVFAPHSATISINSRPLAHKLALNPPPIRPGLGKRFLTIPAVAAAAAKDRRARDFPDLKFAILGGHPALVKGDTVYYWLARSVNTPHDPRALPSVEDLSAAANSGASTAISALIESH